MRKLLAIAAAVGLSAAAMAPLANAQGWDHRDHRDRWEQRHGDHRGWERRHWDRGYHRGWRHDHVGYAWRGRHWGNRAWECHWRHHQRFCAFRYW